MDTLTARKVAFLKYTALSIIGFQNFSFGLLLNYYSSNNIGLNWVFLSVISIGFYAFLYTVLAYLYDKKVFKIFYRNVDIEGCWNVRLINGDGDERNGRVNIEYTEKGIKIWGKNFNLRNQEMEVGDIAKINSSTFWEGFDIVYSYPVLSYKYSFVSQGVMKQGFTRLILKEFKGRPNDFEGNYFDTKSDNTGAVIMERCKSKSKLN